MADPLELEVVGDLDRAVERALPALAAMLLDLVKTQDGARHGAAPLNGVQQNRRSMETSPPSAARSARSEHNKEQIDR
jgi:hypothetical protein